MLEFFSYFFGQGEEVEFTYFSWAHILPILILGGVIALIVVFGKKLKNWKHEGKLRFALAFTAIVTEMSYFWRLVNVSSLEKTPIDHLPITVCGWAIIFCSYLVVTKNKNLFDIAYFWVFAGSIFGILTPTVITYCGPTRFRYYQFWLEHTLGFVILFYMMFVHGMRPNIKSIFKSYGMLLILGVIAIIVNNMIPGANYLFMAMPEDTASILDILPKNYVVRVLLMAFLMSLLFFLSYLPWLILDIRRKKKGLPPVFSTQNEPITITTNNTTIVDNNTSATELKTKNIKNKNSNKPKKNTSTKK